MRPSPDIRYDVASVLSRGARDYQEDALSTDFPIGSDVGFAVLSDGMGGHAAGDVASKIVVTEVYSELKFLCGTGDQFEEKIGEILRDAAEGANECVRLHASSNPDTAGMGATLLAPVFMGDRLFWVSIGDSPFFMFRDGYLSQLNEDHSLGPQIDFLVRSGMMSEEVAKHHPDRNALTSVLIGEEIERMDCPETPMHVRHNDIYVVASDGLQFLGNRAIADILRRRNADSAHQIASDLLAAVDELGDPEQDNVSFSVIKVRYHDHESAESNIFMTDFENSLPARPIAQPDVAAQHSADNADSAIYLRRRWLATDGSF